MAPECGAVKDFFLKKVHVMLSDKGNIWEKERRAECAGNGVLLEAEKKLCETQVRSSKSKFFPEKKKKKIV